MQNNTTFLGKAGLKCVLFFIICFAFHPEINAQSTPTFANTITSQSDVEFSNNSIDGNLATRARIKASPGIAVGIGAYSGHLEIQFPTTLPANTTSYVKIQTQDNILPSLLGGSLGLLLSNVLGTALIGNQEFTVQAKNGNSVVLQGQSQIITQFSTNRLRIVVNKDNDYFIAITPNQEYDRIRLINRVGALVGLNNTKRLDVYGVYYNSIPDACGLASWTSFDGSGLTLQLLNSGNGGVINPSNVLDSNPNNFSRLSLGTLGVGASVQQTIRFDKLSNPTDLFYVRLRVDPSLLAVGVANNIQIIAANGSTVVQTVNLNSLLNLDLLYLLQGHQVVKIPFSPNAAVDNITIKYNSFITAQLTHSLDLYDVIRVPASPVITDVATLNSKICAGSTASLIAQTGVGTELNWYSQAVGGTILGTTTSGQAFVTSALNSNASFYVSSKKIGCPEESNRVRVNISVVNLPLASDIVIPNELVACNGTTTLSPSSSIGGAVFRYYKDQLKTQEITTGFTGDVGVTYVKNNTTGALSITNLNENDSPYSYYVSITADGICENAANTLKQVIVNFSSSLVLDVAPSIEGCASVNLKDAILNFENSTEIQYNFYDSANNPISLEQASNITLSGIYYVQSTNLSGNCSSALKQVNVSINSIPVLNISTPNQVVVLGSLFQLQTAASSTGTITWFDSDGNQVNSSSVGPFNTTGFYSYTAVATIGSCSVSETIFLTVINPDECPLLTNRVYANSQSWSSIITGGVANANLAIDGNPQTFSTIVTGLGLLGVGTTWQNLQWDQTVPAGTPVTIKIGSEYSGLILAGAYTVVGTKRNALGYPMDIGVLQPISGALVDLLPGQNVFEFTFVPSNLTGPKDYDGVKIVVGSLLSIAQNVKVYEAYYNNQVTQLACNSNDVKDIFYGSIDLGVGVATATVGVDNAFNSVDNDVTTYATMFSGAGILSAADLTIQFNTPTLNGDSVKMILSRPATILDLNLLTGFTIQKYLGNTPVGLPIEHTSSLLNLVLLSGGSQAVLTINSQNQVYDRIKIRFGGVVSVLDILRVHEVKRVANTSIIGADANNTVTVCQNDTVNLSIEPESCATFIWYDSAVDGNIVSTGTSYTIPSTLASGTYNYYVQPIRFGCPVYERGVVTVIVGENTPSNAITKILVNGANETTLCSNVGSIVLEAEMNTSLIITNPVFYWYAFDGTDMVLLPNENSSTLTIPNLPVGNYTYAVGLSSDEYCQTLEADRTSVSLTILPTSTQADITIDNVLICANNDVVLLPQSIQPNSEFFWFFSNNTSQPITNGLVVDGTTYTILSNGQLTISGLTNLNSPYTYFVGVSNDVACLNQAGSFKPVSVVVNDSGTPTTNNINQSFCSSVNPTLASIQINETNIIWYDLATGGSLLSSSTHLISGSIYYAAFDASTGCESAVRLAITVTINDAPTPTTLDTTQDFCVSTNPLIGNIQVNEPNVVWYSDSTNGVVLDEMSSLVDGATYYASLTDAVTGCESSVRLAITVSLNDEETPTTSNTTQNFCLLNNPTIANIQVNESNVVWYATSTGGNPLASTDSLVNNTTYYASITDAVTGCESSVRLAILVTISNLPSPTTNNVNQSFCLIDNPTVATIQVYESNVIWYDASEDGNVLLSTLNLVNGQVYYATLFDAITGCESTERLAITVTVNDPSTPTTMDTTQDFCWSDDLTIANIQVNESNVVWYDSEFGGTALALTTALVDGTIYYASLVDNVTGCESSVRLAITVSLNDASTPTTTDTTQDFCSNTNPTIANIQVNESNVVWYATPTGGTILPSSEALVSGTIYYASFDGVATCQSSTRLAVTVTVLNGVTPTTNNASQVFCLSDNPTVANIQVNETGVIWYTALTGGTAINSNTPLAEGTYFASILDPISGCESTTRLAIAVSFTAIETAFINGGNETACVFEEVTYATNAGMTNYIWTVSNGTIVSGGDINDNSITILWSTVALGNVSVTYTDDCSSSSLANINIPVVSCSDIAITKTVDVSKPSIGQHVNFTITVNNVGSGHFYDVIINEQLPSGYSFVSATTSTGSYSNVSGIWTIPVLNPNQSATLILKVEVLSSGNYLNVAFIDGSNPIDSKPENNSAAAEVEPLCLVVFSEFSPNGDGANETFRIDCIESFPNNKLEIFNRYGKLVFSKNDYSNDWDGTANVSGAASKDEKLPAGTYYYVLTVGLDGIVKTGWVSFIR